VLLVLGGIGLYASTLFGNPYATTYPVSIVSACLGFLLIKRKHIDLSFSKTDKYVKSLMVAYFILLSSLPIVFLYDSVGRTVSVFAVTFVLYSLVALAIVLEIAVYRGLALIIITGIAHRATAFYSSSLYVGIDIYGHVDLVNELITEGTLSGMGPTKYLYSPFYHLLTGWSSLLMNVPLRSTIFLTVSVTVTVLPALAIYIIGSRLLGEKVGLLSALLYTGSDFVIQWGIHAIPTSLGIIFFALTFLYGLKYLGVIPSGRAGRRNLFLYIAFQATVSLTHHLSFFVTVTVLGAAFLGKVLYESRITSRVVNLSLASGALLYLDFVVTRFGGPGGDSRFLDTIVKRLAFSIMETSPNTRIQQSLPEDPSIYAGVTESIEIVHVAGSAMLLAFGILGVLLWLNRPRVKGVPQSGFVLGVAVGIPLAITFAGPIFGLRNLLPFRWFAFFYLPLSILAAYSLIIIIEYLVSVVGRYPRLVASVAVFVVCLPFFAFMGGNFVAAQDGPLFDDASGAERLSTTESELALYTHVADYGSLNRTVFADARARSPLGHVGVSTATPRITYGEPNSISGDSYLVSRGYLQSHHAKYQIRYRGNTYGVYGAFPVTAIDERRYSTVYDTGEDQLLAIE
jgi:hypothetical protein